MGAGGVVEVGSPFVGVDGAVDALRSRVEKSAAVAAAPVRADTLAIIAIVVLDIVDSCAPNVIFLEYREWRRMHAYPATVAVIDPPCLVRSQQHMFNIPLVTRWMP